MSPDRLPDTRKRVFRRLRKNLIEFRSGIRTLDSRAWRSSGVRMASCVSRRSQASVGKVSDKLKTGGAVEVKVLEVDKQRRIRLSATVPADGESVGT